MVLSGTVILLLFRPFFRLMFAVIIKYTPNSLQKHKTKYNRESGREVGKKH